MVLRSSVQVGFFLDPEIHRLATDWCTKQNLTFAAFCQVAVAHYFLELAAVQQPINITRAPGPRKKGKA